MGVYIFVYILVYICLGVCLGGYVSFVWLCRVYMFYFGCGFLFLGDVFYFLFFESYWMLGWCGVWGVCGEGDFFCGVL